MSTCWIFQFFLTKKQKIENTQLIINEIKYKFPPGFDYLEFDTIDRELANYDLVNNFRQQPKNKKSPFPQGKEDFTKPKPTNFTLIMTYPEIKRIATF